MAFSARSRAVFLALAASAVACGGSAPAPASPAAPAAETSDEAGADAAVAGPAAAEPAAAESARTAPINTIPEIEARVILAEMFRGAGYRILYDVPVPLGRSTVAIDGFDPDKKLGFEYRAASELSAWSGEIPDDAGVRVLVIDATDRDTVEARARAFLAAAQRAE